MGRHDVFNACILAFPEAHTLVTDSQDEIQSILYERKNAFQKLKRFVGAGKEAEKLRKLNDRFRDLHQMTGWLLLVNALVWFSFRSSEVQTRVTPNTGRFIVSSMPSNWKHFKVLCIGVDLSWYTRFVASCVGHHDTPECTLLPRQKWYPRPANTSTPCSSHTAGRCLSTTMT